MLVPVRSALPFRRIPGDPDPLKRRLFDPQRIRRCPVGPRFSRASSFWLVLRLSIDTGSVEGRENALELRSNADITMIQLRSEDLRMLICVEAIPRDNLTLASTTFRVTSSRNVSLWEKLVRRSVDSHDHLPSMPDLLRKSFYGFACFGCVSESSRCHRPVPLSTLSISLSSILSLSFSRSFSLFLSLSLIIIIIIIQR